MTAIMIALFVSNIIFASLFIICYAQARDADHFLMAESCVSDLYRTHYNELVKENQQLMAQLIDEREKNRGYSENPTPERNPHV